ncbi:MAG: sulfatase-like hydrolase/transferase [Planctomycetaceae bacterium]|nr:sulfatase-like hydrolase/transferase [Planctomycetaceae bacterium]
MKKLSRIVFLFMLFATLSIEAVESDKPNIIFILTDDQGWSESSVLMHPDQPYSQELYFSTPSMERLAAQGRRFSNGYAPAPICTPTRRALLVGMTTARTRGSEFKSEFDPRHHLTIPQALKKVDPNYRCAHFGKWGEQMIAKPDEVGYDESDGDTGNLTGNGGNGDKIDLKQFPSATNEDPKLMFSLVKRSIDFMERQTQAGKPFYLQLSCYAAHYQLQATETTAKKYERKSAAPRDFPPIFAAMVEEMDKGIGQVLDAVEKLGIAEKTYIILGADNGGSPHTHVGLQRRETLVPQSPNYPLLGYKQELREGGIRVPFIVKGPGIAANSWSYEPVAHYDLLPTFVDLAGGDVASLASSGAKLDGGSIKTLLLEGKGEVKRAVPGLVFHRPDKGVSAFRSGDYKIFHDWNKNKTFLYNLTKDIGEQHDLAEKEPEKLNELKKILFDYLETVNAEPYSREKIQELRQKQQRIAENKKKREKENSQ